MSQHSPANFTALQSNGSEIKRNLDLALPIRGADDEEASLVARLKKQDEAAFTVMVKGYQHRLLGIAWRITGNRDDAEEVVQDVFLKVFQNVERFREESRFRTWLTRIATNEALMKIRGKTGFSVSLDDDGEGGVQAALRLKSSGCTPEETYSVREIQALIQSLISQIRLPYQPVMQLCLYLGLSQTDIAKHLRLTPAAVKTRLFRARRQLRDALKKSRSGRRVTLLTAGASR